MDLGFPDFDRCQAELALDERGRELWGPGWPQSQAVYPDSPLPFIQEEFVAEIVRLSGLEPPAAQALQEGAAEIRQSEMLRRFTWHCHWRLNLATADDGFFPPLLTRENVAMPAGNCHVFTLATLAPLPRLKKYYAVRGIPEEVLANGLQDLRVWTDDAWALKGVRGCLNNNWMHNHIIPNLFALGRLEFQFGQWYNPVLVYKKKNGRELKFISQGNVAVSAEGYRSGNVGEETAYTTIFREEGGQVTGHPALPDGTLSPNPVTLSLQEWEQYLNFGDPVINMHIPAGAPLLKEACAESIRRAWEFFPRYFPEFKFKALVCSSWLFDPALAQYLPDSNIAGFQSLFHLYPFPKANSWQTRQRVFGDPDLPLEMVPQKTTLQKIVKKHLLEGKFWHSGGAFLLRPEEEQQVSPSA